MENRFTNKNTLDQAWSMMSITLDKEMPIQKKRRAIWWIPIGIGLMAIASWRYIAFSDISDTAPQQLIQHAVSNGPITNTEEKSINIISQSNSTYIKETNLKENKKSESKYTSNFVSHDIPKSEIEAPLTTIAPNQAINNQKVKVPTQIKTYTTNISSDKKEKKSMVENQNLVHSNLSTDETEAIEDKNIVQQFYPNTRAASSLIDPLPTLNNILFEWEIQPIIDVLLPENDRWCLGLKSVFLTNITERVRTPTLLVEGQFTRKFGLRWSLYSGLGLKSQKFISRSVSSSQIDNNNIQENADFAFSDNGDLQSNISFHFLYIPIGVKYNFKGRWSIDVGGHYNFLQLSNRANDLSKSLNIRQDNMNLGTIVPTRTFNNSNLSHFSYFLTMNYKLRKKASLFAQYQGNTQRFSEGVENFDTYQFGLGMLWQF